MIINVKLAKKKVINAFYVLEVIPGIKHPLVSVQINIMKQVRLNVLNVYIHAQLVVLRQNAYLVLQLKIEFKTIILVLVKVAILMTNKNVKNVYIHV